MIDDDYGFYSKENTMVHNTLFVVDNNRMWGIGG